MDAFTLSFGIIFLAELGDKTMFATITLAAQLRPPAASAGPEPFWWLS